MIALRCAKKLFLSLVSCFLLSGIVFYAEKSLAEIPDMEKSSPATKQDGRKMMADLVSREYLFRAKYVKEVAAQGHNLSFSRSSYWDMGAGDQIMDILWLVHSNENLVKNLLEKLPDFKTDEQWRILLSGNVAEKAAQVARLLRSDEYKGYKGVIDFSFMEEEWMRKACELEQMYAVAGVLAELPAGRDTLYLAPEILAPFYLAWQDPSLRELAIPIINGKYGSNWEMAPALWTVLKASDNPEKAMSQIRMRKAFEQAADFLAEAPVFPMRLIDPDLAVTLRTMEQWTPPCLPLDSFTADEKAAVLALSYGTRKNGVGFSQAALDRKGFPLFQKNDKGRIFFRTSYDGIASQGDKSFLSGGKAKNAAPLWNGTPLDMLGDFIFVVPLSSLNEAEEFSLFYDEYASIFLFSDRPAADLAAHLSFLSTFFANMDHPFLEKEKAEKELGTAVYMSTWPDARLFALLVSIASPESLDRLFGPIQAAWVKRSYDPVQRTTEWLEISRPEQGFTSSAPMILGKNPCIVLPREVLEIQSEQLRFLEISQNHTEWESIFRWYAEELTPEAFSRLQLVPPEEAKEIIEHAFTFCDEMKIDIPVVRQNMVTGVLFCIKTRPDIFEELRKIVEASGDRKKRDRDIKQFFEEHFKKQMEQAKSPK